MAVSRVVSLLMVAFLLGSAVAQSPLSSPSPAPTPLRPRRVADAPSPLLEPPSHSPLASPAPAPVKPTTPPSSSSPSPSPAVVLSPPSPPPSEASPSPSVALPPSSDLAPVPSTNGAILNRLGFAAVAAGFFAVALVA